MKDRKDSRSRVEENKRILQRTSSIFLLVLLLLLIGACSKYYRYGQEINYTVLIERVFTGTFSTIEAYLNAPPEIVAGLDKATDFSCEVKEALSFLERMSGIQAYKTYEIRGTKLSEQDSSLLVRDLEKWKAWYEDNKPYLFLSKDHRTLKYKKGDTERVDDLSAIKCRDWF